MTSILDWSLIFIHWNSSLVCTMDASGKFSWFKQSLFGLLKLMTSLFMWSESCAGATCALPHSASRWRRIGGLSHACMPDWISQGSHMFGCQMEFGWCLAFGMYDVWHVFAGCHVSLVSMMFFFHFLLKLPSSAHPFSHRFLAQQLLWVDQQWSAKDPFMNDWLWTYAQWANEWGWGSLWKCSPRDTLGEGGEADDYLGEGGPGLFEKYSKAEEFCEGFNNLENDHARSGHLRWQCFKPAAVDDDEIKKSRRAGCLEIQVDHKSVCNTHVLVHCLVVHCKWHGRADDCAAMTSPSSRNTMDEEVAWRWLTPMRRTTEEEGFLRTGFLRTRSGYKWRLMTVHGFVMVRKLMTGQLGSKIKASFGSGLCGLGMWDEVLCLRRHWRCEIAEVRGWLWDSKCQLGVQPGCYRCQMPGVRFSSCAMGFELGSLAATKWTQSGKKAWNVLALPLDVLVTGLREKGLQSWFIPVLFHYSYPSTGKKVNCSEHLSVKWCRKHIMPFVHLCGLEVRPRMSSTQIHTLFRCMHEAPSQFVLSAWISFSFSCGF